MKLMRAALFSVCAAAMAAGQATVHFYEPFNDNSAGWTLGAGWAVGPAVFYSTTISGNPLSDPGTDKDGVVGGGVVGTNIGGSIGAGPYPMRWLTSPVIDLTGSQLVLLEYSRVIGMPDGANGDSSLEVWDGSTWVEIWNPSQTSDGLLFNQAWVSPSHDVSAYINAAFQFRFGYRNATGVLSGFANAPGWTIDNVTLSGWHDNDDGANALPLAVGVTQGHLYSASGTNPQPASCGSFTTSSTDCWYTFSTPVGGNFDFTRAGGSRMALYTGADCSTLVQVPGRCGTATTFTNVAVAPNTTYWLRLGGPLNSEHTITVALRASLSTIGVGSPVGTVLSGSGAPVLGSVGTISLDAEPFRFGLLLMAPPNDASVYTPIDVGTIYLANPGLAVLLSYYTDAAGQWSLTVPFPSDPAYTGFAVELQCLNFGPFEPETSNALRLVMGP